MDIVHYGIIGIKGIGDVQRRAAVQSENVELTALVAFDAAHVKEKWHNWECVDSPTIETCSTRELSMRY